MFGYDVAAALRAITCRGTGRTEGQDQHGAFAAHLFDQVFAGDRAGLDVVGLDGHVGARCPRVGRDDGNAALVGAVDRRLDGVRVAGAQHDQVDAGGDEGVDLGVLRGRVKIVLDGGDLDVRVDRPGFKFG